MKFSCQRTADGLRLTIGPHEGSYPAWWKEICAEIYGFTPKQDEIVVDEKKIAAHISMESKRAGFVLADDGNGYDVELK
jgi:alpha-glucosidase